MSYAGLRRLVPAWLQREVFYFESRILDGVREFAEALKPGARVLDAGAGEGQYQDFFSRQRYVGVDLGVGDVAWNYSKLDCVADLLRLPFADGGFDAFVSVVTLEHVTEPGLAIAEMARVAKTGATLFLVVPHEWEVHQHPHDYWRFTKFGVKRLLETNGWEVVRLEPGGGFFRLLSRRLMNGLQFLPGWLMPLVALGVAPLALIVGWMDGLDSQKDYTLGYICWAKRRSQ
ncbi:MAG: class I SAM-dependent methyltransferase [Acidobacteria bacterium]|nr:class I SAM-dependent methyltransferase [Acidobacteriota bacterium]